MNTYLDSILTSTRVRVAALRLQYDEAQLRASVQHAPAGGYARLHQLKAAGRRIVIAEYKRSTPTRPAAAATTLESQVQAYLQAGVAGISVLTEPDFFGGSFAHLSQAAALAGQQALVLQKDFVLDPIQVLLARQAGAHAILLIADALPPTELLRLAQLAHELDMCVLLELHDAASATGLPLHQFPLIGINHRDLRSFKLALGRSSALAPLLPASSVVIAESGIHSLRDAALATAHTHGVLVGNALMSDPALTAALVAATPMPHALKACGVRTAADLALAATHAELVGINLSPQRRRAMPLPVLDSVSIPPNAVAVLRGNEPSARAALLQRYPFTYVQLYADEVQPAALADIPARVLLSLDYTQPDLVGRAQAYAPHVHSFILEGPTPGSGALPVQTVPADFPYPFMLGGGLHADNLATRLLHPLCWGADVASGLEDEHGHFSHHRLLHTLNTLSHLHSSLPCLS